jgi:hypothetical protein
MRRVVLLVMLAVSICTVCPAQGRTSYLSDDEVKAGAERGLGEILELWHNKKFDDLYERTLAGGKQTRKAFVGRLAAAPHRPACCWQQMQDVKVTVKNDDNVVIRAKIGLEGVGDAEYRTGSFKLRKEDGIWRISRSDILSLAGATKKKGHRK